VADEQTRGIWRPRTMYIIEPVATLVTRLATTLTAALGSGTFLVVQIVFFGGWILINSGSTFIQPFDPPPYILLALIASIEAIMLSTIVLISQNMQSETFAQREKLDFEINVRSEEEITKILNLLDNLRKDLGVEAKNDVELEVMKQKTDLEALHEEVNKASE
jgi:uncharacterized membrane protein